LRVVSVSVGEGSGVGRGAGVREGRAVAIGSTLGLVVQAGRATIRVEVGFDAELLRNVVAALGELT